MGHQKRVPALGAPHLETRRRHAALVDRIRGLAGVALDLKHLADREFTFFSSKGGKGLHGQCRMKHAV
jgi:hypothetical protein